ncbi:hypothetical protein JZO77_02975 [Enterococcus hulanensis]|nr:hypothetical protein [Enterococcus hulanensis]MBO0455703.1 hypothetical protein [Enterococcus hulanensis]
MGNKQCLGERINLNNIGWKDLFIPVIKQLAEINLYPMIELSRLDIQN